MAIVKLLSRKMEEGQNGDKTKTATHTHNHQPTSQCIIRVTLLVCAKLTRRKSFRALSRFTNFAFRSDHKQTHNGSVAIFLWSDRVQSVRPEFLGEKIKTLPQYRPNTISVFGVQSLEQHFNHIGDVLVGSTRIHFAL